MNLQGSKEDLKERIQAAKDKIEEYKRRGMSDITIRVKQGDSVKEIEIDTLKKHLENIGQGINDASTEEELVNFVTELEIKEAIIKELGKTLPCKPIVPHIDILIKKKRCCWRFNRGSCCSIVALVIAMVGIGVLCVLPPECSTVGYFIALLVGVILGSFYLHFFIIIYLNGNYSCKMKMLFAFLINLIFSIASTWFVRYYPKDLSEFCVNASITITLLLLLIITYCSTKLKSGDDISLLKKTSSFLALSFAVIKYLSREKAPCCTAPNIVDYSLPFSVMLPFLYDLFDREIEKKDKKHAMGSDTTS